MYLKPHSRPAWPGDCRGNWNRIDDQIGIGYPRVLPLARDLGGRLWRALRSSALIRHSAFNLIFLSTTRSGMPGLPGSLRRPSQYCARRREPDGGRAAASGGGRRLPGARLGPLDRRRGRALGPHALGWGAAPAAAGATGLVRQRNRRCGAQCRRGQPVAGVQAAVLDSGERVRGVVPGMINYVSARRGRAAGPSAANTAAPSRWLHHR